MSSSGAASMHSQVTLEDDPSQYLVVIVDTNPAAWSDAALLTPRTSTDNNPVPVELSAAVGPSLPPAGASEANPVTETSSSSSHEQNGAQSRPVLYDVLDQLFVFLNAFTLLNPQNRFAIITTDPFHNKLVYPTAVSSNSSSTPSERKSGPSLLWGGASAQSLTAAASAARQAILRRAASAARKLSKLRAATAAAAAASSAGTAPAASPTTTQPTPATVAAEGEQGSLIAGALSQALCLIARAKAAASASSPSSSVGPGAGAGAGAGDGTGAAGARGSAYARCSLSARVLVLQAAADRQQDYVGVMNAIFVAQRQGVLVDGVKLGGGESVFLHQAAFITQSLYTCLPLAAPSTRPSATPTAAAKADKGGRAAPAPPASPLCLLQHLMTALLPPAPLRPLLRLPATRTADLRATCFCHSRPVERGEVCPVCVSVYCKGRMNCPSCGVRFVGIAPLRGKMPGGTAAKGLRRPAPSQDTAQESMGQAGETASVPKRALLSISVKK